MMEVEGMNIHVDGRGVSRGLVRPYGRIDTSSKNRTALASAQTDPGPNPDTYLGGNGAMGHDTHTRPDEKRLIALEYLQRVADDLTRTTLLRIHYMAFARENGATWRDIATALGMTETGARVLFNRNVDILDGGDS